MVEQFPAVAVTGARQVGKTSLVRKVLPEFGYASLGLPAAAEQAESSPEAFLDDNPSPLIIDEIRYAPSLIQYIKVRIDADRRPGKYVLTGSQNFPLMQGISESMAGRCGVLAMTNWKPRHARPGWSGYHRHALSRTSAMIPARTGSWFWWTAFRSTIRTAARSSGTRPDWTTSRGSRSFADPVPPFTLQRHGGRRQHHDKKARRGVQGLGQGRQRGR